MGKNRMEAFSDGVFAIVITLLVLDIKIPDTEYSNLPSALVSILPSIASYVLSFMVIGLYWAFHHFYIDRLKKINGTILFLNILSLLLVSFMPFPTSLMGRYPFTTIPVLIYGLCLFTTNMLGLITVYYIDRNSQLTNDNFTPGFFKAQYPIFLWVNIPYILALGISFRYPMISYFIFVFVLIGISLSLWHRLNNPPSVKTQQRNPKIIKEYEPGSQIF